MATLLANAYLARPSVLWCFDLYWDSAFPITFPWTFDVAPFRVSSTDLYPGGVLGDVLYEARMLEKPSLTLQAADAFSALEQISQLSFRLLGTAIARWRVPVATGGGFDPTGFDPAGFDVAAGTTSGILLTNLGAYPNLHPWVPGEHRGKLIVGHLVEVDAAFNATAIQQNLFQGELLALADDPGTVSVAARAFDLASLTDQVPATVIGTDWAPYAPTASLGQVVPFGIGIGRKIPCLSVKAQTDESTEEIEQFTADPTTDLLTATAHGFGTGTGPMAVSSSGTLPAPLAIGTDYWIVAVDDDTFRLATTLGNAMTDVTIDITTAGTGGPHLITGGLAQNLAPDWDVAVGTGNLGIVRIWEDQAAQGSTDNQFPDTPVTYSVLHKSYRPNGRYLTAVRFPDQMDGIAISADVLRCYPDVDDAVLGEWKWLTGFQDDVGGFDAVSSSTAPQVVTTAALRPTHQGFGLGGIALNASQWLDARGAGSATALDSFTVEVEAIPALLNTGSRTNLVSSARGPLTADPFPFAWQLCFDEGGECLELIVKYADGSTWNPVLTTGSSKRGLPLRATLVRDGSTGTMTLFLGRTQAVTDTRAAKLLYAGGADRPPRFGGPSGFNGTLGWIRFSNVARPQRYIDNAYYLWRRSPIEFCRELAADARRLVDGTTFDSAAAAIDQIEGGMLRADGWMVDLNQLSAVLDALAPFRDLQFTLGQNLALQVAVAAPPATLEGQFGHGDDYANLVELPTRARASLTEAIGQLICEFRRERSGAFNGYMMELVRTVSSVGKPTNLQLPFVDHPVTADIIGSFREHRTRTRDQTLTVACGHEARGITKGDAFRLNVPSMGITDQDLETLQVQKTAERVTLLAVPTNDSDFTYVPSKQLPADPASRTLQPTDLGDFQTLTATLANKRLTLRLNLLDTEELYPAGNSALRPGIWPFFTGAATHWQCIDDPYDPANPIGDSDTSYIQSDTDGDRDSFTLTPQTKGFTRIDLVEIVAITAAQFTTGTYQLGIFFDATTGYASPIITDLGDAGYLGHQFTWTVNPATGQPWTPADIAKMNASITTAHTVDTIRATQIYVRIGQRRDLPLPSAYAQYWVIGPQPTQPPPPLDTDAPFFPAALDLAPQVVDLGDTTLGNVYWCWAGIYDEFGRRIALIGPATVSVS
jgi:hypothetical protein